MNGCTPLVLYDRVHTIVVLPWSRNFKNSYLTIITCLSIKNEIIHKKQQSNKGEGFQTVFIDKVHVMWLCQL